MSSETDLKELEHCDIVVALAGQPNVGKSTLFNRLTGELARVGNFPGTTVEMKIGRVKHRNREICIVDLPGTYGLSAYTLEERVARMFILNKRAHVVVVLVDSTLPERTMYLALQVLEMVPNVVIALTKWDLAHRSGVHVHVDMIEKVLGVPIVPVSAISGEGIRELLDAVLDIAEGKRRTRDTPLTINYGVLESYINELVKLLEKTGLGFRYPLRWVAIRLLEGDTELLDTLRTLGLGDIVKRATELRNEVQRLRGRDAEELIAEARFAFVERLLKPTIVRVEIPQRQPFIEKILQKPILGTITSIVILFGTLFIAFAINTGFPLNLVFYMLGYKSLAEAVEAYSLGSLLGIIFDHLSSIAYSALENVNPVLASLAADGIIPGVGAVLSFLPLILIVMLLLAALEDSGLGPRMAVAVHSFFTNFGLSGRSVYPMLIALGCNVPAVMASRAAIDDTERLEIALTVSFIPCQARLVVLTAFASALFPRAPHLQAVTVIAVYLIGMMLYLASSKLLRVALFKQREAPEFLLEVPPLHRPNLRVVWWNAWDSTKHFLKKAGFIIFALSVIVWVLLSFGPHGMADNILDSYGATLGRTIAPLFSLLFHLDPESAWKIGFALIMGFVAKEGLISTLAILSGLEEESGIIEALHLSTAQGIAILLLMMYYMPCLATAAVIYQETRSVKLTLFAIAYLFVVALAISLLAFTILSIIS